MITVTNRIFFKCSFMMGGMKTEKKTTIQITIRKLLLFQPQIIMYKTTFFLYNDNHYYLVNVLLRFKLTKVFEAIKVIT